MPNGGSDCCGTCWFNSANKGKAGYPPKDRNLPHYCEIRDLDIENPFYTYCANHPHHRPDRDPIPIGPVHSAVYAGAGMYGREPWEPSPDSEEIRQHLLDLIRLPEEEADKMRYPLINPAYTVAIQQLVEWRDERVIDALEERAARPEEGRKVSEKTIRDVRKRLGL